MSKYIFANLLVLFSGFFMSGYYIDPVYITFIATVLFLIVYMVFRDQSIHISKPIIVSALFFAYLFVTQFMIVNGEFNTILNVLISLIYFFMTLQLIYNLSSEKLYKISNKFIFFSILVLIVEMTLRILNPTYEINGQYLTGNVEFYAYKMNSFLYQDSNYVGAYIVSLFFFAFYLDGIRPHKKYKIAMLILFLLCVFTFSRASILTIILFFPFFWTLKKLKTIKFSILFIIVLIPIIMFLYNIENVFLNDGSFISKLGIIELTLNHIRNSDLSTILLGVGFGNSHYYLGIGAHNIFVTYLIESGIIGISFLVILWVLIVFKTNFSAIIIVIPVLFNGMSLSSHATPYLYAIFAIILVLSNRHIHKGELLKC